MDKVSKELLGLAGEYAVASELCRRGLYSQLTLGNHKRTDILIETDARMLRISVKAKQGNEWPSISGPTREDDFLVFVDCAGKKHGERFDYYILGREDWKELLEQEISKQKEKGKEPKIQNGTVIWPDGWKGINVRLPHVIMYKEKWETITSAINPQETLVKN